MTLLAPLPSLPLSCIHVDSPLGELLLAASEEALVGAYFEGQRSLPAEASEWSRAPDHPVLSRARAQLAEFFMDARATFDLPLAAAGTDFQRRVWGELLTIPRGAVRSYGDVARAMGLPHASRAVGAAIGRNPISLFIPCHRVIGATGALTGYAGGLDRKRKLLELEGFRSVPYLRVVAHDGSHPLAEQGQPGIRP
jgi:methylated-DNA-[protein]-cysteine S-methyltransferase